jgi:iron complex transport system permease protein
MTAPGRFGGRAARLLFLCVLLLAVLLGSMCGGAVPASPAKVLRSLFHAGAEDTLRRILLEVRMPRVLLAAVVGAALSVSGALLQAFFQNPMAGPYVVGVSSGAGLLAVAAITLGLTFRAGPFDATAVAAFVGGLGSIALVYALARRIRYLRSEGLLLIGIAVGAVFSALTSILLLFSREGVQAALLWMLGSFAASDWPKVSMVTVSLAIGGLGSVFLLRDLNLLLWGDETARSLGSPVTRIRGWVLVFSSLLASAAVAACGVVGFIGLMVPHLARAFLDTVDHRFVIPGSALIGAVLLMAADAFARTVWAPSELPVGAITSAPIRRVHAKNSTAFDVSVGNRLQRLNFFVSYAKVGFGSGTPIIVEASRHVQ